MAIDCRIHESWLSGLFWALFAAVKPRGSSASGLAPAACHFAVETSRCARMGACRHFCRVKAALLSCWTTTLGLSIQLPRAGDMAGWHVNYYSVTRRTERRSGASPSFDGALVHARALAANGHIVRSICSPSGVIFAARTLEPRLHENEPAKKN
jgi:hypothetical protein